MPFKVQVGPSQIAVHEGETMLVTENDGQIRWPSEKGLYFFDTRVISSWSIQANGEDWDLLNGGAVSYYAARIFLINRAMLTEDGTISARVLGLTISRSIGGGMHEDIDIVNRSMKRVRFQLEIALRSDFADIFEVRTGKIVRRGRITTEWSHFRQKLQTTYRNQDFMRKVTIAPVAKRAVYANGRMSFEVELGPGENWHNCLAYTLEDSERTYPPPTGCAGQSHTNEQAEPLTKWLETVLKIRTSNEEFYRMYRQALEDIAALRLPIAGTDRMSFIPAGGLPWYIAPFGRDSLIVTLQNTLIYPEFAHGVLEVLGSLQAHEDDPYRDAEPGKIPHERRFGELAHFKLIPHTPYYGTADATPLYLITLHAAWRAIGDSALLKQHLETAEGCLAWIDKYGDRDGDGFQEYQTRSPVGYENMGWKDSDDAIVYPDGTQVKGPKALCELQAYVYDAWVRMAEVFDALDQPGRAEALRNKAAVLFKRFNDAFWDEEMGFYVLALDGDKKKVRTVASNAGHCLACGIVPRERAKRVVDRLMQPDMWSGGGIRTLSSLNPAFNPYNYQTGSVWPHDNAIIAIGFKRYGFGAEAARIAHDISKSASRFLLNQLPELYTVLTPDEMPFPVQYIGANVPQAWAAGSAFMLMQAILGFVPDAPRNKLYIDPLLPAWLPDLTVIDMRVGQHKLEIRFWREGERTQFEVIKGDGAIVVRRDMARKLPTLEAEYERVP